jgi:hypothetical protein
MTKLLPLWVGARGVEFDWKYMQMSFDANIALVSVKDGCMMLPLDKTEAYMQCQCRKFLRSQNNNYMHVCTAPK